MANLGGMASGAASGASMGMALGPWGAIAGGLVGGLTSMFSGQSEADAINEKIRRAQALAAESLVDNAEISSRLNSIDRMFNQRLTSTLNTTAIRSRGFANSGTIGAAVAGGVEGDRLAAKSQTVNQSLDYNKQVQQSIAQMELGTTTANPVADFVTGATSGIALGMEVEKYMGQTDPTQLPETDQQKIERGQTNPRAMTKAGDFNPYLRGQEQGINIGMGTFNPMQLQAKNPFVDAISGLYQPKSGFNALNIGMGSQTRQGSVTVDPNWGYQFPDGKTFGTWGKQ